MDTAGYRATLLLNFASFLLPALYQVLSKVWIANLDPSFVVLTDAFTYLGAIGDSLGNGLAKGAWTFIGDKNSLALNRRYEFAWTLMAIQSTVGVAFLLSLLIAASSFTENFVPATIRDQSVTYVRLTAISTTCGIVQTALAICTRALDQPLVPLAISVSKVCLNIVLDLIILSPFRPVSFTPTVNDQAWIRAGCDVGSTLLGVGYLFWLTHIQRRSNPGWQSRPSWSALFQLLRAGAWTQLEVVPRTALNLWLTSLFISLGPTFATAYGIFLTIRVGVGYVPLLAVEATCQAFTSHAWNEFRLIVTANERIRSRGERKRDAFVISKAVLLSMMLMAIVEIVLYLAVGFGFGRALAFWLSASEEAADLAVRIWRQLDWAYIFLALYFQSSSVLLMASPRLYCLQSVFATVVFSLPISIGFWSRLFIISQFWLWFTLAAGCIFIFQFFNNIVWSVLWLLVRLNSIRIN